ncbi:hypothetical protein E2C01_003988 [Portunus trituberculatus]|uniref:Uncharacterized protein n=1 Tax=Portunus trituberculatus TaxID=210409 RepID=A0A5B7CSM0_PORTR|nr:hypothetical protein [Portunus trituberculatus]
MTVRNGSPEEGVAEGEKASQYTGVEMKQSPEARATRLQIRDPSSWMRYVQEAGGEVTSHMVTKKEDESQGDWNRQSNYHSVSAMG